jgi:hypothetical protein
VIDGLIYAVGGVNSAGYSRRLDVYDPSTNTWRTKASMPTARDFLGTAVVDDTLYAIGGVNQILGPGPIVGLHTVEAYRP